MVVLTGGCGVSRFHHRRQCDPHYVPGTLATEQRKAYRKFTPSERQFLEQHFMENEMIMPSPNERAKLAEQLGVDGGKYSVGRLLSNSRTGVF